MSAPVLAITLSHCSQLSQMHERSIFELNSTAFAALSANISFNHLVSRTKLNNAALSNENVTKALHTPTDNLGATLLGTGCSSIPDAVESEWCRLIRGDDIVTEVRTFIKIDVEGHELECIEGLEKTISNRQAPVFDEIGANTDKPVAAKMAKLSHTEVC